MVKTNGAEFKKFYSDPFWDNGCYHDDVAFKINGKVPSSDLNIPNIIGDTDVVLIKSHHRGKEKDVVIVAPKY